MKKYIVMISLLWPLGMAAQEVQDAPQKGKGLTIDAEVLSRGELRLGGLNKNDDDLEADKAQFVVSRARLTAGYQRDSLSLKVSFQHEGLWGMEGGSSLNMYEAWAQLKFGHGFFVRAGRQELTYDDQRILGNNDWAMAARSHDVLKVGYENHGHKVHAFFAYNQNAKNMQGGTFYENGAQPYKTMQSVWYHYDVGKIPLGISLLFMNVGMQTGTEDDYHTENQHLYGGYVTFAPKNLKLEASYYRQGGKASLDEYKDGAVLPLKSWMGSVKATYDFNPWLTGYAGYDYLSGDKDFVVPGQGKIGLTRHTEINAFTSIFGSLHKFYGAMDFFYVSSYYGTNSPGLQNLYGGVKVKPLKGLSVDASYHYMAVSSNINNLKKTLGHEVELSANYNVLKDVKVSAGYSLMSGTETMEKLQRTSDKRLLRWGWLMVVVTPRIF